MNGLEAGSDPTGRSLNRYHLGLKRFPPRTYATLICLILGCFLGLDSADTIKKPIQYLDISGGAFGFPIGQSNANYGFYLGMGVAGYLDRVRLGIRVDGTFINTYSSSKYGGPWLGASDYGVVEDVFLFDVKLTMGLAYGIYFSGFNYGSAIENQSGKENTDLGINFGGVAKSFLQFRDPNFSNWGIKITYAYFFPGWLRSERVPARSFGNGIGVGMFFEAP